MKKRALVLVILSFFILLIAFVFLVNSNSASPVKVSEKVIQELEKQEKVRVI